LKKDKTNAEGGGNNTAHQKNKGDNEMIVFVEVIIAAAIVYFAGMPIVHIFETWKKDENE
jgi:hypothetical protein